MQYVDMNKGNASRIIAAQLRTCLEEVGATKEYGDIAVVCIGTDRSTGDSLGPLVGYKLQNIKSSTVKVYGSLESPVHAKNLNDKIREINSSHDKPLILAVNACLGKVEHVGFINVCKGSIIPGSGVSKDLPPVGDVSVKGIVNMGGFMDLMVLQNTRLGMVMKMAEIIASAIRRIAVARGGEKHESYRYRQES
jgi:putative sporulation protein YyaC